MLRFASEVGMLQRDAVASSVDVDDRRGAALEAAAISNLKVCAKCSCCNITSVHGTGRHRVNRLSWHVVHASPDRLRYSCQ
eukprot:364261-Chlamydomonas_euryale.AAC.3